jgi:F-type H+-transporting ATPase subunit c
MEHRRLHITKNKGEKEMDSVTLIMMAKMLGAGFAAVGILGGGVGIGLVLHGTQTAIARNPELSPTLSTNMWIGIVMCETTCIYCLAIAFMLLFVLK